MIDANTLKDLSEAVDNVTFVEKYLRSIGESWYADIMSDTKDILNGFVEDINVLNNGWISVKDRIPKTTIEKDPHLPTILLCAMRYALGRETYMPGLVQDFIRAHAEALDDGTRQTMIRDIEEADYIQHYETFDIDGLGSTTIDRPGWLKFKEWLEKGAKNEAADISGPR